MAVAFKTPCGAASQKPGFFEKPGFSAVLGAMLSPRSGVSMMSRQRTFGMVTRLKA